MFLLLSISSGLEFLSVNHAWIYGNSVLNIFENLKFFSEISNNWPNDLLAANY